MNTIEIKKEPVYWIDLIRTVAIFLVIVIHVATPVFNEWDRIPPDWRVFANIYEAIARMSVPLFFMTSGSLLLQRSESFRDFFVKRINKVLLPFIVWSIIYLFWGCIVNNVSCGSNPLRHMILIQGTYYHLWFMYPLLGLYLITPILRLLIIPDRKYILYYFIGLWLVFEPILGMAQEFWDFEIGIEVPMATGFIGLYILGYLFGELILSKRIVLISTILWILSTAVTAILVYYININTERFEDSLYDYLSINVIISSASGFLLLRWLSDQPWISSGRIRQLVQSFAKTSFGIYLIHIIVLEVIGSKNPLIHLEATIGNPVWTIPFVSLLVFLVSFFIIYIMQRTPIVKKIVP